MKGPRILLLILAFTLGPSLRVLAQDNPQEASPEFLASLQKARTDGDARSLWWVANCYEVGRGVHQDQAEAANWYRVAADRGDELSATRLSQMYSEGIGVAKDDKRALLFSQVAEGIKRDKIPHTSWEYATVVDDLREAGSFSRWMRELWVKWYKSRGDALGELSLAREFVWRSYDAEIKADAPGPFIAALKQRGVVSASFPTFISNQWLSAIGDQGWDLVAVSTRDSFWSGTVTTYYFRRKQSLPHPPWMWGFSTP